jgi:hypothetical protein
MPTPAAPTSLTLNQPRPGDPTTTLSWLHNQTNLDRFEILRRTTGTTIWTSILLGPASDFGSAGSYAAKVGSELSCEYKVRALGTGGEVST